MASGWANESAVQEQIDATIDDAIARARNQMTQGESAEFCDECGEAIPLARQKAIRGVRYCINCQEAIDKKYNTFSGYNRRGSKDSQLR
ncbi:DksA/TraR family C4-type zinc finger protein [Proteus mirabilis]|uniref:DksA/TraR family C4-type zinc finger protein n=1 Tax=Proteus mirabilis TaxID=584 RepID=UPI0005386BCA|nr:DksA/TraR family C4-type zinc finger protein [Proteus mirabilis]AUU36512.1 DksA/TraR family C4-type zinc finger protein [Proteus mirabilis]MBG2791771.1 DksA/TraR family C4-type zinc finger protein [Proteus mirabilis]MBG2823793.1 DksA/TraR family C4-type zinc finger protein [Proteus mirabilis]WGY28737.1 DksA/TraR family C4-type zinc finger protein [Proteus mirabilis]HCR3569093.1 DksA/TraR family C4-type zinc finger protein [Proteus mirabilis]